MDNGWVGKSHNISSLFSADESIEKMKNGTSFNNLAFTPHVLFYFKTFEAYHESRVLMLHCKNSGGNFPPKVVGLECYIYHTIVCVKFPPYGGGL